MKLLILGGSGFVSGSLARIALNRGDQVWTVTRGSRATVPGVKALICDRNDASSLSAALSGEDTRWDAVLDCICFNADQAAVDLEVLPRFTKRIIVVSTDSVYHPAHKTVPQDEEAAVYLEDGGYGANKRLMELAFQHADTSLDWTLFRPGHIFGPGSELGCFPEQSRQKDLLSQLREGKPMRLVGGGQYLIHPIFVDDLAQAMLDCIDRPGSFRQILCIGGPDIIPNREYYEILGQILKLLVTFEVIPEDGYLEAHPECSGHLCHRAYSLKKLKACGIPLPATHLIDGLAKQVDWLISQGR